MSGALQLGALGALDWAIVVAYLLGVIGLGALASRGQEDEETYFLGGRSVPLWAVTLSIVATSLSAATYVGLPAMTFRPTGDLSYLILNIGGVLGALAVALLLLPRLYRAGTTTIYGAIGQRYGEGGALAASVTFLIGRLLASGARLFIAGIAFSTILFGDTHLGSILTAVVLFGVIGTAYTCLGGIRAVIWTDTLQIVLVVGAALASIAILWHAIPLSAGELWSHLEAQGKLDVVQTGFSADGYDWAAGFTLLTAFAVAFQNAGSYGCDHDLVQRMMTTRSPWQASASLLLSQVVAMPIVLLFMVIGLLLSVYYGSPDLLGAAAPHDAVTDPRRVYPQFLLNHMPPGLAGLAMAGLFAAAMSSLDSAINAMAAALISDVIEPVRRWRGTLPEGEESTLQTSRWIVAGAGGLLVVFAVLATLLQSHGGQRLIDFALGVMTFALSGLLGVFFAALYTRRGNVTSVVAALISGAVVIVLLQQKVLGNIAWPWWMAIASPISFAVCCIPPGRDAPAAPKASDPSA